MTMDGMNDASWAYWWKYFGYVVRKCLSEGVVSLLNQLEFLLITRNRLPLRCLYQQYAQKKVKLLTAEPPVELMDASRTSSSFLLAVLAIAIATDMHLNHQFI